MRKYLSELKAQGRILFVASGILLCASGILLLCQAVRQASAQGPAAKKPAAASKSTVGALGSPELTDATTEAIDRGFEFLVKDQTSDGSWANAKSGPYKVPVANTSLALMAFMVKGHFPGYGKYADTLDRGKKYLLNAAKKTPDGYLGTSMYEHGLATLALSEMWGMTKNRDDDEVIRSALQACVKVILRSQDPRGSWTYLPKPAGGDTSITIMQLVALASARQAGILVPDETIDRGVAYLKSCQSPDNGGFAYTPKNTRGTTYACSAGSTYVLHLCGQRNTDMLKAGVDYMKSWPEQVFTGDNMFYYYIHYYGLQAIVQDSDDAYAEWYPKIRDALLKRQQKNGSWLGGLGGAPQSTTMAILTLGTPHRFLPIYQR
jgi:hypothetical protein